MMLSGEPVGAGAAVASGLADALATGDLVQAARTHALKLADGGAPVRVRDRGERLDPASREGFEAKATEAVKKAPASRTWRLWPMSCAPGSTSPSTRR